MTPLTLRCVLCTPATVIAFEATRPALLLRPFSARAGGLPFLQSLARASRRVLPLILLTLSSQYSQSRARAHLHTLAETLCAFTIALVLYLPRFAFAAKSAFGQTGWSTGLFPPCLGCIDARCLCRCHAWGLTRVTTTLTTTFGHSRVPALPVGTCSVIYSHSLQELLHVRDPPI